MLLSICIATRNRADYLRQTVDSIMPQLSSNVELVVIDGASTDGTHELMTESCFPTNVKYVRLEVNGGLDKDYDVAVHRASGDYCWLFTDDDILLPGTLDRVLDALSSRPSAVVVDAEVRDVKMSHVLVPSRLSHVPISHLPGDALDTLMMTCGSHLTFIGALVIERKLWLSRERASFYGCYFLHVAVLFQAPLPSSVIVLNSPCVSIRLGNASWTARAFEIWNILWPQVIWSSQYVSEAAKLRVVPLRPWQSVSHLLKCRILGMYSATEYRSFIASSDASLTSKVVARIIAAVPGRTVFVITWVVVLLFIRNNKSILHDMRLSRFNPFNARNSV
jgi:glycosyltransferase involved in cell wall biosynthesis